MHGFDVCKCVGGRGVGGHSQSACMCQRPSQADCLESTFRVLKRTINALRVLAMCSFCDGPFEKRQSVHINKSY